MKINISIAGLGVIILMVGIYLSTLMTTTWVIIGTIMAMFGGGLTGVNGVILGTKKE